MYRRPLPSTNLGFLSAVMWDGRESSATTTVLQDLAQQADDATMGHAQAARHLTDLEKQAIVAFETGSVHGAGGERRRGLAAGGLERQEGRSRCRASRFSSVSTIRSD